MKHKSMFWSAVCSVPLTASLLLATVPAKAGTVAYWRFEQGPAGAQMAHLSGTNGVWSPDVPDSSGNGNALSVWTGDKWAGYAYRSDVPFPVVPETGAPNNFSVQNTGGNPAMWNNTLEAWSPSAWTVEASFKPENGGYRTIVGRDSKGATTNDPNLAAMYFQLIPGDAVAIKFADAGGVWHEAISAPGLVKGFDFGSDNNGLTGKWYNMAAVSDGSTLSLYLNDIASGMGYQLVAQTDMTTSGSANTALSPGLGSSGDWMHGDFSVGRGLYAGNHVDRAWGFIDEVRLSDAALMPGQFLGGGGAAIPEPGTCTLALIGAATALLRRRRSAR